MKSGYKSNHDLMRRVKNSCRYSFSILYKRLWESTYSRAFSILGDKSKAKDIVQEVWISVWERRHKISHNNIEGYLLKAVRFKVYNEYRNSKCRNDLIKEFIKNYHYPLEINDVEQIIQFKDTQKSIYKEINHLPKKCQQVFKLSRLDGLKNEEIAKKLHISKRTVETHIFNALKILKKSKALFIVLLLIEF